MISRTLVRSTSGPCVAPKWSLWMALRIRNTALLWPMPVFDRWYRRGLPDSADGLARIRRTMTIRWRSVRGRLHAVQSDAPSCTRPAADDPSMARPQTRTLCTARPSTMTSRGGGLRRLVPVHLLGTQWQRPKACGGWDVEHSVHLRSAPIRRRETTILGYSLDGGHRSGPTTSTQHRRHSRHSARPSRAAAENRTRPVTSVIHVQLVAHVAGLHLRDHG